MDAAAYFRERRQAHPCASLVYMSMSRYLLRVPASVSLTGPYVVIRSTMDTGRTRCSVSRVF